MSITLKKGLSILLLSIWLFSCGNETEKKEKSQDSAVEYGVAMQEIKPPPPLPPLTDAEVDSLLLKLGDEILMKIKNQQWAALSEYTDSSSAGIRFSIYGRPDAKDLQFKPSYLQENSSKKFVWGMHDGSGEPINLTIQNFCTRYIYKTDFLRSKSTEKKILTDAELKNYYYKSVRVVRYYHPGTDKFDNLDWLQLDLVFSQKDGNYKLIGLIQDQWTI